MRQVSTFAGRLRGLAATVLLTSCAPAPADPPADERISPRAALEHGTQHAGRLEEGTVDRWEVDLENGQVIKIEAGQEEVDLIVRLRGPDGAVRIEYDSPISRRGPERFCWQADQSGRHTVEVTPFQGAGAYRLHAAWRTATDAERACARASSLFVQAGEAARGRARAEVFEASATAWEDADDDLGITLAWRQVGSELDNESAFDEAIAAFEKGLSAARRAQLWRFEVSIRNRLAKTLTSADRLAPAREQFDEALWTARNAKDPRAIATTLTNRGIFDTRSGDPFRGLERLREAAAIWRTENDPIEIAQVLANRAETLGILDHHDEALDALDDALGLVTTAQARRRQASILVTIGWTHYLRGKPEQGIAPLRRALHLRRNASELTEAAGVLDRLGTVLLAAGEPEEAEARFREALEISRRLGNDSNEVRTATNLGCLWTHVGRTGRRVQASVLLRRSRAYFQTVDDPKAASRVAYCLAKLARDRGDLDTAISYTHEALSIIDDLRQRARKQGHIYNPIWLWQDYAEFETALFLERFDRRGHEADLKAAFAATDEARARTLHEILAATRHGAEATADQRLAAEARAIETRLAALASKRRDQPAKTSDDRDPALDAVIRRQRLDLERVRAAQRANVRQGGRAEDPKPIGAQTVQDLLAPGATMLTYALGDERSHLFVLTRDELTVLALDRRKVLEDHAEALHEALRTSDQDEQQWQLAAESVGHLLLPTGAIPSGTERLLINAEGALLYVPFGMLRQPGASATGDVHRSLAEDFDIVGVPSASVWARLTARRRSRGALPRSAAVFADPVFSERDDRFTTSLGGGTPDRNESTRRTRGIRIERLPQGPLPRLPATAREVDAIFAHIAPRNRLDRQAFQASKRAVLDSDLRSFGILHFATHAWIDERLPELSGLVLSRFDSAGHRIDGALYLHEIDRLRNAADLVVLSGCQTALGEQVRGDGLIGLTQGFLRAGASRVLVTLWSLDDEPAAAFMETFYRYLLGEGDSPARALRRAQHWMRTRPDYRAPRYWAPFVLQGAD